MSYCRWSSDNFRSDLYVYESVYDCWTIHVAGVRYVGEIPSLAWPKDPKDRAQVAAWVESSKAQHAFLDKAEREPIDLPHAGETFNLSTPGECADKIEELIGLGYRVPTGVVEALRDEQAQMDAPPHITEGEG